MTDERTNAPANEQDTSNTAVEANNEPTGDPSTPESTSTTKATSTTEPTTASEPATRAESDQPPTPETSQHVKAENARAEGAEAQGPVRAASSEAATATVATPSDPPSKEASSEASAPSAPSAPKPKTAVTADKPTAAAAEKPKKAAPPPDPRVEAAKLHADALRIPVVKALGEDSVEDVGAVHTTPMIRIRNQNWREAVETLKDHPEWKLNYVECMAGVDYPEYIEIVLYVQSTSLGHFVCLKTRTDRTDATVPSLASVYPAVNWEEREIYDLLGVHFQEHPDLRRIMMWDEFKGHPLRKDYNEWDSEEEDQGGTH